MKKLFAAFICVIVILIATGCSNSDDDILSSGFAPDINEFGIQMEEKDFISAFSERSGQTVDKENPGFGYLINGNTNDKIDLDTENGKITHLTVSCSGATKDKAKTVERVTDYFKSVILVLYPNTSSDEINNLLKQIRYETAENDHSPKEYLFNDLYIIYSTSFGPSGLTFSDSKVTIVYCRIESIEYFNK